MLWQISRHIRGLFGHVILDSDTAQVWCRVELFPFLNIVPDTDDGIRRVGIDHVVATFIDDVVLYTNPAEIGCRVKFYPLDKGQTSAITTSWLETSTRSIPWKWVQWAEPQLERLMSQQGRGAEQTALLNLGV